MIRKIKYQLKRKRKIEKGYLFFVGTLSLFLLVGGFSYALFTVETERRGTLNIITGNLYSLLESSELDKNHSVSLTSGETKTVTITLKNINTIDAKFNLWYTPVEGVSISYDVSHDTPPTKEGESFSVDSKKVYQLNITNNTGDEQKITFGSDVGLINKPLLFPSDKKEIIGRNFITVLKGKVNDSTKVYESATEEEKKEMFTFTHETGEQQAGWSAEELTDYRYIGTNPNNYVTFNDELWRIIGVFTVEDAKGKKEERVKLIREESIGNYSFDNKSNGEGSSNSEYGSSDWSDSRLKDVLNSGAYYNRTKGTCPAGQNNTTIACDFSSNGLTPEAKSMLASTKWYLGAVASSYNNDKANEYYRYERGTEVYSGRALSWIGEVGMVYPSDYGYATSGSSCLNTALYSYSLSCASVDWLHDSKSFLTITPYSKYSYDVSFKDSIGRIDINIVSKPNYDVRPNIYLKSSVNVISGDGSSGDPYTLDIG